MAKLQENSQAFSNWMHSWRMLTLTKNWDEILPDLQIILVDYFSEVARTEILEQVYLAKAFYDNIEEKISSEQRKQLEDAIYVEKASGQRDLRGRLKQLDRNWDLERLHPKVDWDVYFS